MRAHHLWWLSQVPRAEGEKGGVSNNWWQYVVDPNLVPCLSRGKRDNFSPLSDKQHEPCDAPANAPGTGVQSHTLVITVKRFAPFR